MIPVTAFGITQVLKAADCPMSAKAIAVAAGFETMSENLRMITDECYDMAESGYVFVVDRREQGAGLFFEWSHVVGGGIEESLGL